MMSESQARVEEKGPGKSPYLAARDEWNERYRDLIVAARNWRLLAVTTSAVALVAVLGLIVIGTKPKVIPYIVAVDNLGKVVSQGTAVQASVADDRLKRAALWSWVQDWRMVSSDATVEKNAVERVYAEIGNGTPAAIKISDGYIPRHPSIVRELAVRLGATPVRNGTLHRRNVGSEIRPLSSPLTLCRYQQGCSTIRLRREAASLRSPGQLLW